MIYLIDASVYIFRAWFSVPAAMTGSDGQPVNALYGFARFLGEFLESASPRRVAVAFDESLNTSFRNEIYPAYKGNRELPPPELERQIVLCRQLTAAMGLSCFSSDRFEADDIIGTIACAMRGEGIGSVIVSRDKDLAQLLRPGDQYWDFAGRRRFEYDEIRAKFGASPEKIADFLALTGDSVDNIPGVPGVGKKTAEALMDHFDSMDAMYANLDQVAGIPVRGAAKLAARLALHRDKAELARRLTTIPDDVPLQFDRESLKPARPDLEALNLLYDEVRFGRSLRDQAQRLSAQTRNN